jgi:CxxC motif-containing protein (DUF1111 family)
MARFRELRRGSLLAYRAFFALALSASLMACGDTPDRVPVGNPGTPLPGLSEGELARFNEGREWFHHGWTPEEGRGPLHLQDRCSSCHDLPTLGGTGVETLPLASRFLGPDGCDLLVEEGGPVIQQVATPLLQAQGVMREGIPASATERSRVTAPLLYGLGLVEAIPEESIRTRADPDDADDDGISGRVSLSEDGRLGRFTRKGAVPDLPTQAASAASTDLGLTSHIFPLEQTVNGSPLPAGTDPAPDPELRAEVLEKIVDFVRFLAPPAPERPTTAAARDTLQRGEALFDSVGCTSCHTPSMQTGPSETAALDRKTIRLYSDLLIHDLGPEYRSVCSEGASTTEARTARLQGFRYRYPVIQDLLGLGGIDQTILRHGGEATAAKEAFAALSLAERGLVIRFLLSL